MNTPFHTAMLALDKEGPGRIPDWAFFCSMHQQIEVIGTVEISHRFGEMKGWQLDAIRTEIYDRMVDRQTRRIIEP